MFARYDFRKNYQNGDKYTGEAIEDGVKDGKGQYFFAETGATYKGEWKKNVMHGKGEYIDPRPGSGYVFTGLFVKGERQGRGSCRYQNGRTYEGEWVDGVWHGTGQLTCTAENADDFAFYNGPFESGLRHGANGECSFKDSSLYSGEWVRDEIHGEGKMRVGPTGDSYCGSFVHNQIEGKGRYEFGSRSPFGVQGETYTGQVSKGAKHGKGVQQIGADENYSGDFVHGQRQGDYGVLRVGQSVHYEGAWHSNEFSGYGTLTLSPEAPTSNSSTQTMASQLQRDCQGLTWYQGIFSHHRPHGDGEGQFRDGSRYNGQWSDGLMHGNGHLSNYPSADPFPAGGLGHYSGAFQHGLPHGRGKTTVCAKSNPKVSVTYDGEWVGGVAQGIGSLENTEGWRFEGEVFKLHPHGSGKKTWIRSGEVYKGSFDNGRQTGEGRIDYKNQDHYQGEWLNDLYHGQGTFHCYNTSDSYQGEWKQGQRFGVGTAIEYGKSHYHGQFAHDKKCGTGVLKFNNGTKYDGEFASDQYHGRGSLTLQDGTLYEGEFAYGHPHGRCKATFTNGNKYDGNWVNGTINGEGDMTYTNFDRYIGSFVIGERCGPGKMIFAEKNVLEATWTDKGLLHGEGLYTARDGTKARRVYENGTLVREEKFGGDFGHTPNLSASPMEAREAPAEEQKKAPEAKPGAKARKQQPVPKKEPGPDKKPETTQPAAQEEETRPESEDDDAQAAQAKAPKGRVGSLKLLQQKHFERQANNRGAPSEMSPATGTGVVAARKRAQSASLNSSAHASKANSPDQHSRRSTSEPENRKATDTDESDLRKVASEGSLSARPVPLSLGGLAFHSPDNANGDGPRSRFVDPDDASGGGDGDDEALRSSRSGKLDAQLLKASLDEAISEIEERLRSTANQISQLESAEDAASRRRLALMKASRRKDEQRLEAKQTERSNLEFIYGA